ncbi:hypothetical protein, conserved [Trypanosoma brucei gambiense DAL972]|uniref:Uncharacterized protein n=2 Tax=Trypanosoma brucei TaxID=5691 RepID=C9ZZH6_TRYB9|nr:hypothetical protein, conserved [Trypanosoma brucei gambiense DAL972]RHW70049.1 hypothetical protein DPX39_090086500 [Trypanosoma brucei equiperdum]CBH14825.1 hypothetical protein, conserved [Trypanosoma brucei gambiense DAL972]|eukprot:XP_011777091.1 hypothetical protein, conserved [Trypanosoma brucei gambiense DAL972]
MDVCEGLRVPVGHMSGTGGLGLTAGGGGTATSSVFSDLRELNEAKVSNILSYLDDVVSTRPPFPASFGPSACRDVYMPANISDGGVALAPSAALLQPSTQLPPFGGSASCLTSHIIGCGPDVRSDVYHGIKAKISALQFSNDELRAENEELKERVKMAREREAERLGSQEAAARNELEGLRKKLRETERNYERVVQEFQRERSQLTQAVESVTSQLRQEMSRREEEIARLESANATAIAQLKTRWQAQEKAAREKWRIAEAKRIKENTLQSLEPDIVLLLNRHKAEKARMREEFENELRQRDEVIAAKEATLEESRARLEREASATRAREQQEFRDRLKEEMDRVNRQLEEERRLAKQKHDDLEIFAEDRKNTMQREISQLQKEVFTLREAAATEKAKIHEEVAREVANITANSNQIVSDLKEKLMLEFSRREQETKAYNVQYLAAREEELRHKFEAERDAAVAEVTRRAEQQHLQTLMESHGADSVLRDRCAQMGRENERLRAEVELLQGNLRSVVEEIGRKEEEMSRLREASDLTNQRVKEIQEKVRAEDEARMHVLDSEWQRKLRQFEIKHVEEVGAMQHELEKVTIELQAVKNAAALEQRSIEQKHNAELTSINERVLVALATKDNTLRAQTEQISVLQEAIRLRDEQIARHRELL